MKTFFIIPDFDRGGIEWQMFVRAANVAKALALCFADRAEETGDDAAEFTFRKAVFEESGNNTFTTWEFPDQLPETAGVIGWKAFKRQNWTAKGKDSQ